MALSGQQRQTASMLYNLARSKGLPDNRAREFVAASYAESGLNPSIRNKSSGATGLFQLLSSGYVNKANQLGGVANPRANALAILPDYQSYWQKNPRAGAGAAARDVERSGEGAGFYAGPLRLFGGSMGNAQFGGAPARPVRTAPVSPQGMPSPGQSTHAYSDFARSLISAAQSHSNEAMLGALMTLRQNINQQQRQPQAFGAAGREAPGMGPGVPATGGGKGFFTPVQGGKVIGTPYQGTHAKGFNQSGGSDNWESENANDISIPVGTPIRAVTNGTIGSQFGSLGSGGRFAGLRLHLQGAGNEWYYAHLSKFAPGIKPGARVRAGQVIGYSGEANGVPHLHIASRRGHPPT